MGRVHIVVVAAVVLRRSSPELGIALVEGGFDLDGAYAAAAEAGGFVGALGKVAVSTPA